MIQRIQSIYLLVATVLWVGSLFLPVTQNGFHAWGLIIVAIAGALFNFIAIFLYKNRKTQRQLCVIGAMVALIYYVIYLTYYLLSKNTPNQQMIISIGSFLPILSFVFTLIANHQIKKDDDLIKAADRIR